MGHLCVFTRRCLSPGLLRVRNSIIINRTVNTLRGFLCGMATFNKYSYYLFILYTYYCFIVSELLDN